MVDVLVIGGGKFPAHTRPALAIRSEGLRVPERVPAAATKLRVAMYRTTEKAIGN